jgi:hypothetical protein
VGTGWGKKEQRGGEEERPKNTKNPNPNHTFIEHNAISRSVRAMGRLFLGICRGDRRTVEGEGRTCIGKKRAEKNKKKMTVKKNIRPELLSKLRSEEKEGNMSGNMDIHAFECCVYGSP